MSTVHSACNGYGEDTEDRRGPENVTEAQGIGANTMPPSQGLFLLCMHLKYQFDMATEADMYTAHKRRWVVRK